MISYEENDNKFNFRVSAIILDQSGKNVLIHQIKNRDFWLLPGGRVEMMESTQDAIIRELREELDIGSFDVKLAMISEDFFGFSGKVYDELGFVYVVKLGEDSPLLSKKGIFEGIEGEKYLFKWHEISKIKELDFRPSFYVEEIENINKLEGVRHLIVDERKQLRFLGVC